MIDALGDEIKFLAEVGQLGSDGVQLGRAASGTSGAALLGGGFVYLVQVGHRAEDPGDGFVEQAGELLGPGRGETVVPVGGDARMSGPVVELVVGRCWCEAPFSASSGGVQGTGLDQEPVPPRRTTAVTPRSAQELKNRQPD
ncbi:hypothetical protein ACSCBZ_22310 [Streptomyces niveiscabiei]|uniref:hypothetical protein n=1 Tax=Streptomyces niveiscabiei TaxID=164115 RepID=UPI00131ABF23|nr:hypothetical protein [Streptomyces niveiscabiei]